MELVQDTKVLLVYQQCDKCKEGFMEEEETEMRIDLAVYPPRFPHKCNNCGHVESYLKSYPHQMLVPVGELRELLEEEKGMSE